MKPRWIAALIFLCGPQAAWSGPPRINTIDPPAVQRGVEGRLQFTGKELDPSAELLVPFAFESHAEGGGNEAFNVMFKASSDALPGAYPIRVRTADGVSNLRLLVVGDLPVVRVQEPNGGYKNGSLYLAKAQTVQWPCIISG